MTSAPGSTVRAVMTPGKGAMIFWNACRSAYCWTVARLTSMLAWADSTCAAVVLTWPGPGRSFAARWPCLTPGFEVPIERDLGQLEVGLGHVQIGLGQDEVGAGLGELVVHVRRADLGEELAFFDAVADVHQPAR